MVVHVEPAAIEIAATPERVREVVLDFAAYLSWHKGHFNSIKPKDPNKKGIDLIESDKLEVSLSSGMNFSPAILEKSATRLEWRGSLPGIFTGDHCFEFHPSQNSAGGTRFLQYEDFSGLLSFTMKSTKKSGEQNSEGFVKFNEDLKRRCEENVVD
ncbi:hypothetical protein HII31_01685 [Pseudocercospora fuligena]|uniref:Uncharacterized protein n=1 Tax=Pseudocercospora fuligena TaxID=685502 RepID=A0A8H6VS99_9PEZI|nr:hypothetical protein HII31_01685 [Pseudocercospora fuligena]